MATDNLTVALCNKYNTVLLLWFNTIPMSFDFRQCLAKNLVCNL